MSRRRDAGARDVREERKESRRVARREQLLSDAIEAIRRMGPAVTMEQLSAAGGVTKPIVYRHFGDRDGLIQAIGERFAGELLEQVQGSLASDSGPRDLLRSTVDGYLAFIEREPNLYRFLMQQSAPRSALAGPAGGPSAVVVEVSRGVAAVIRRQLQAAGLRDDPAEPWAFGIVGMVYLVGDWWLERQTQPRDVVVEQLTSLLWDGFSGQAASLGPADRAAADRRST